MKVKCAECQCAPQDCLREGFTCQICTKAVCCCIGIHVGTNYLVDDCCSSCEEKPAQKANPLIEFFRHARGLYAAAVGIEILCIAAAEIGENVGLYLFGLNALGIAIAYVLGYALAGFTTFATILGRYNYRNQTIGSCCSALEQDAGRGFISNLKATFRNFAVGIKKMLQLHRQPDLKQVLRTSLYILVTAESACILTAETVGLIFYQYSLLLSVPLALLAGAFAVVLPEAYRKARKKPERPMNIS